MQPLFNLLAHFNKTIIAYRYQQYLKRTSYMRHCPFFASHPLLIPINLISIWKARFNDSVPKASTVSALRHTNAESSKICTNKKLHTHARICF